MSIAASVPETVRDLIDSLGVPPERILLRPAPGAATEADLLRCSRLCELIDGVLVEKTMGFYESRLAAVLVHLIESFLEDHPIGFVLEGSGMIRIGPGKVRLPDVSFLSWDHFPDKLLPADEQILNTIPDLAVEILSPSNTSNEMERKRQDYFTAGCKLYWEMDPATNTLKAYTSFKRFKEIKEDGVIGGGNVLPGFTLAMQEWLERAGKRSK